ncbi:phosphatidylcholine-sterol acyltransferase [Caerostris extrusa]|uniref:Phosphatidylcholine-sterol acyltransferase n=1 Tax=Caerostris extrusa TaxID=172846 RepID=A0AAV4Q4Q1_CAEEX|nr:phosphatidylcholine-sterol acyltransferase [Caerostris extrusa]
MLTFSSLSLLKLSVFLLTLFLLVPQSYAWWIFHWHWHWPWHRATPEPPLDIFVKKSPVILVPGDGGSRLLAKLDKTEHVHFYCSRKTKGYYKLWLNQRFLSMEHWTAGLTYNTTTRRTTNSPGVDIIVPEFGNTTAVESLVSRHIPEFMRKAMYAEYYIGIVKYLEALGFKKETEIKAAPYDYRKGPNEMEEYYANMTALVQETYDVNLFTPVTIVCHSLGCPLLLISLTRKLNRGRTRENLGIRIVSQKKLKIEQKTCPSMAYMLPSRHLWLPNETIAMTNHKNYTVAEYEQFFKDINYTVGYEMYKDNLPYSDTHIKPPEVDFRKSKNPDAKPDILPGPGDGTINQRSLEVCSRWKRKQKQRVRTKIIDKLGHLTMLYDKKVHKIIKKFLTTWW